MKIDIKQNHAISQKSQKSTIELSYSVMSARITSLSLVTMMHFDTYSNYSI